MDDLAVGERLLESGGFLLGDFGVAAVKPLEAREAREGGEVRDLGARAVKPLEAREAREGGEVRDLGVGAVQRLEARQTGEGRKVRDFTIIYEQGFPSRKSLPGILWQAASPLHRLDQQSL